MSTQKRSRPEANRAATNQGADGDTIGASTVPRRTDIPWAKTSVYTQAGRRRLLQAAATCPTCLGVTVHRIPGPEVTGLQRWGACGHRYLLSSYRTYSPREVA
jgi:hypothetical protein